ncbi:hypothetical protein LTR53_011171 [Teratosphaeriaceae sp. CCFEE 6253]|nr:hypothetical protein LTR53_011171 [Teratosphaeriaceae sp. CCFEE 6253]
MYELAAEREAAEEVERTRPLPYGFPRGAYDTLRDDALSGFHRPLQLVLEALTDGAAKTACYALLRQCRATIASHNKQLALWQNNKTPRTGIMLEVQERSTTKITSDLSSLQEVIEELEPWAEELDEVY